MTKKELRQMIRQAKAAMMPATGRWDCSLLLQHLDDMGAKTVLMYNALPDEVPTAEMLEAWHGTVLLPVVAGDELMLRQYTGETVTGPYGIAEPVGPLHLDYDSIDAAIVPGMAFTRDGKRLGRGRGYYDRLLPQLARCHKIGLCFGFQIVDYIPCDAHDVAMDEVWEEGGL